MQPTVCHFSFDSISFLSCQSKIKTFHFEFDFEFVRDRFDLKQMILFIDRDILFAIRQFCFIHRCLLFVELFTSEFFDFVDANIYSIF